MSVLEDIFSGKMWRPVNGFEFKHSWGEVTPRSGMFVAAEGAVVVLPARHMVERVDEINDELVKYKWVLLIVAGDEESLFPVERIKHRNMKVWIMTPLKGTNDTLGRPFINGYSGGTPEWLVKYGKEARERSLPWFFAGQCTHPRRHQCADQLQRMSEHGGVLHRSQKFTEGVERELYFKYLASCKIAPCPSGPATPDTFRLYEALEAGCLPLVDAQTSRPGYPDGYWELVFQNPPFTQVSDWSQLPEIMEKELAVWSEKSSRIAAWWMGIKRKMAYDMRDDINELRSQI